jgi:hypothetical protein
VPARSLRRCSATAALAVVLGAALGAPASAAEVRVRISAPAALVAGAPCRVKVSVNRTVHRTTAVLQERAGTRWRSVARKRLVRRSATLRCQQAPAGLTRRFRAVLRRGGRTIARSSTLSTRVLAAPGPAPQPVPPPPKPLPEPPRPPIDPAQFGAEGTGGPPSPEMLALLANPRVVFDATGIADLQAGRIDPRIVAVLAKLAQTHTLTIVAMCSDVSKFTSGGTVSPGYLGRGVDIGAIDGIIVSPANMTAREVASELSSLEPSYRPDRIGSPFSIAGPGHYTDASTQSRIAIAFSDPIDPSWTPPAI